MASLFPSSIPFYRSTFYNSSCMFIILFYASFFFYVTSPVSPFLYLSSEATYTDLVSSYSVSVTDCAGLTLSPGHWDLECWRFSFQLPNQGVILHLVNAINYLVGRIGNCNVAPEELFQHLQPEFEPNIPCSVSLQMIALFFLVDLLNNLICVCC